MGRHRCHRVDAHDPKHEAKAWTLRPVMYRIYKLCTSDFSVRGMESWAAISRSNKSDTGNPYLQNSIFGGNDTELHFFRTSHVLRLGCLMISTGKLYHN